MKCEKEEEKCCGSLFLFFKRFVSKEKISAMLGKKKEKNIILCFKENMVKEATALGNEKNQFFTFIPNVTQYLSALHFLLLVLINLIVRKTLFD